jgi:hypothetical protein
MFKAPKTPASGNTGGCFVQNPDVVGLWHVVALPATWVPWHFRIPSKGATHLALEFSYNFNLKQILVVLLYGHPR